MACDWWDVGCQVSTGASGLISNAADDALSQLVSNIVDAVGKAFSALASIWVLIPTPNLTGGGAASSTRSAASAAGAAGFLTILQWCVWVSLSICVLSLIAAGALMAARHRTGEGQAHLGRVGTVLGGVVLISGSGAVIAALLPGLQGTQTSDAVGYLQSSLWWYVGGFAVLAIVVAGARMAWTQRADAGKELLQSLFTLIVVSAAGLTAIGLAVTAADGFAVWILSGATNKTFGENITGMIALSTSSGIGLIALMILGSLAVLFTYIQVILMVVRGGMLVLLAGIFPLTASFTNTETGRAWFKKCCGWLVAFILYKPAAAIVYATAFKLTGADLFQDDGSGLVKVLTGLALMVMALVALPALMRFVTPLVSQLGGGGSAHLGLAAGAGMAGAELATGAIRRSGTSASSSFGGPTPSAPSGSAATAGRASTAGAPSGGAASGAAAAAGPAVVGVMAAQKGIEAGQKAMGAVRKAAADAAGDGATGSN